MNQNIGSVCVPTTVSTLDNWDRPLTYVITPKKRPAAQDDYPPRCQAGPKWRIAQGLLEASTLVEGRAFTGNYCGDRGLRSLNGDELCGYTVSFHLRPAVPLFIDD